VHPLHLLNALLAELLRILSDSGLLLNSQQSSFLCALLAHTRSMPTWQSFSELLRASGFYLQTLNRVLLQHLVLTLNAHLAEPYRTYSKVLSATVSQLHSLASKVFSNLTGLLLELLTSVLCLSTSLSDSSEFRSASSVHGSQNPQRSVTPSWCEASKTSQA
jgi:hypothetical protein